MPLEFYRGSTPTFKFTPTGGLSVFDLGEPVIAISQELATLTFENDVEGEEDRITIDPSTNTISVTLTEEESIQFADGVETYAQVTWYQYDEGTDPEDDITITDIIKFPQHSVTVLPSILGIILPEDEPVEEDPDEGLDYDTEDPVGTLIVDEGDGEEYVVPDYYEYYDDTIEPQPKTTYLYSSGEVDPVPKDWTPDE